jgi:hypothetical protein
LKCYNANGEEVILVSPRFTHPSHFHDYGDVRLAFVEGREDRSRAYIDQRGIAVVVVEWVCGTEVLKNAKGDILWPQKSIAQICE